MCPSLEPPSTVVVVVVVVIVVVVVVVVRGHAVRWRDADVQEVAHHELGLAEGLGVVCALLAGARHAHLPHVVSVAVHVDQGKVKVGAPSPSVRIDVTHQSGQFSQGGVLPCVDLQLIGRHLSVGVLLDGVVAARVAKDTKKQRTSLENGIIISIMQYADKGI